MSRKSEFKQVKELIKENIEDARCGLFNTRNVVGDYLETLFDGQYFTLEICYNYGYFEVFGMNDEEYQTLLIYYERYVAKYYEEKEEKDMLEDK